MDVDLLHKIIEEVCSMGASYADVRLQELDVSSISVRNGNVEGASISRRKGVGIRVLIEGAWGFSSTEIVKEAELRKAVTNAFKMAKTSLGARRRKARLAETPICRVNLRAKITENPADVDPGEKAKLVLELEKLMRSRSLTIKDSQIFYGDTLDRRVFVSSEGGEVIVEKTRVRFGAYVVASENNILSPAYEAVGGVTGFELMRSEEPYKAVESAAERAVRLLKAKVPRGGLAVAVLDNKLLALIVHEAFGHCAEADLVLSGDVLSGKLGQRVASELVTIVDDPGPEHAYGWTPYDDEGVEGRKAVIVEKGVLKGYMHTRETAAEVGAKPTGNARAQDYSFAPIVRMRNTYMEPGDWKPEEIIAETKEGYYLKGALGGQADANGEFMFAIQEAWSIEKGELAEAYRGVAVSGNALEVLGSVDAVGCDFKIGFPGTCGKGQTVPVDGGGPHIRCKIIVGGAQ
ncbi:MAG: TldD/PmbA family protein [Thermofilaceae archaeon]